MQNYILKLFALAAKLGVKLSYKLAVQQKMHTPFSESIQNVINENEYEFQFYAEFSPYNNKYRALIPSNWEHRANSILWRNLLYSPLHWTWIEFKQIFPFEGGIMTDSLRKMLNSRVLSLVRCRLFGILYFKFGSSCAQNPIPFAVRLIIIYESQMTRHYIYIA